MGQPDQKNVSFSIIIPAFNDVGLVIQSLNSVLCQTLRDYEVIITDDSSTDEISGYFHDSVLDDRVTYIKNNPAKGAVQNWNFGLSMANGKYCILLHHDESFLTDNILDIMNRKLDSGKYGCVVINKIFIRQGQTIKLKLSQAVMHLILNFFPSLLYIINFVGPCSCIAFRNKDLSLFDENLRWYVDVDWYYRLFLANKAWYFDSLFMKSVYGHSNQISQNIDARKQDKADLLYLKKRTGMFSHLQLVFLLKQIYNILKYSLFKGRINFIYKKL
jgi:glycosyltransferase involved in cell wall biosynthesis